MQSWPQNKDGVVINILEGQRSSGGLVIAAEGRRTVAQTDEGGRETIGGYLRYSRVGRVGRQAGVLGAAGGVFEADSWQAGVS